MKARQAFTPLLRRYLFVVFPIFVVVAIGIGLIRGDDVFSAAALGKQVLLSAVGAIFFTLISMARSRQQRT